MSQQNRRFASDKPKPSPVPTQTPEKPQETPPQQPVQNIINQSPISSSTLPQAPHEFIPQELTIHISSDGHKKFVNSRGDQSMIYPFSNKFFGNYGRGAADYIGEHNRMSTIENLKQRNLKYFKVSPSSKIYNYHCLEIHLLSQFYQNLISQTEKQQIIKEYNTLKHEYRRIKMVVLCYTAYVVATHRMKWSKLTVINPIRLGFYIFGGMLWAKSYINLGGFQVNSILEHNKTYENMLKTYENDYKIVY